MPQANTLHADKHPEIQEKINRSFNRLFLNWMAWKVFLPLALISCVYLAIRFFFDIPHPFGKAFAHGDLLVFSALVLMEAATEGEQDQKHNFRVEAVRHFAKVVAIFLLLMFLGTKLDILRRESELAAKHSADGHHLLTEKMLLYSSLNCAIALVSVVGSVFLFWYNVAKEKQNEFADLAARLSQARPRTAAAGDEVWE